MSKSSNNQVVNFKDETTHSCGCSHQEIDYDWAQSKTCTKVYHYQLKLQTLSAVGAGAYNYVAAPLLERKHDPLFGFGSFLVEKCLDVKVIKPTIPRAYHDVLTVHYGCSSCGGKGLITFEFNADTGMEVKIGKYDSYERV